MNLRPTLLDDLGILATLSWFCREFQKANPAIHIETKVNIQENDVANPVKTVIYRVMQEALNNISKHSKAILVNLTLEKEEDKIKFTIQDHGQGFDLNAAYSLKSSEKGLGLAGMKERTYLSGGSMSIESTQGAGPQFEHHGRYRLNSPLPVLLRPLDGAFGSISANIPAKSKRSNHFRH